MKYLLSWCATLLGAIYLFFFEYGEICSAVLFATSIITMAITDKTLQGVVINKVSLSEKNTQSSGYQPVAPNTHAIQPGDE